MTIAIALLTSVPDPSQVSFFEAMASPDHEVFVVADDASASLPTSTVTYVQIDDRECAARGFENLNTVITKKKPIQCSAWEKAIYYFSLVDSRHDHVWFIEDDVFVPSSWAIGQIDRRYGLADVLSAQCIVNRSGNRRGWWWWRRVPRALPLPWAASMVSAVRVSRALLNVIGTFVPRTRDALARENAPHAGMSLFFRRLKTKIAVGEFVNYEKYLFIEYLFHTLALHDDRKIVVAEELSGIRWDAQWDVKDLRPDRLYHPVKDRTLHEPYRRHLADASG